jgi:Fe2+ transport system protein FeoA
MSLLQGKKNSIVSILGIKSNPYKNRLSEMGFVPGVRIKIAENSRFSPLVVIVGESRYSLNKELADDILIEE